MTLFTSDAEYVAMANRVNKTMYVRGVQLFLMPSLGLRVLECCRQQWGDRPDQEPVELVQQKVRYHFFHDLVGKGERRTNMRIVPRERFDKQSECLLGMYFFRRKMFVVVVPRLAS